MSADKNHEIAMTVWKIEFADLDGDVCIVHQPAATETAALASVRHYYGHLFA